uniref:Uncharacterized protein n=1 Tax=Candidatus Methanophagaceae archaeon ANME-1 ERB6 TaxID=2759912 RepID=A0A7G9YVG9_9EURY|nr:hypothetical protein HGMICNAC_00005 [Methanosarcinales archaeon ANME-1 ERB6]
MNKIINRNKTKIFGISILLILCLLIFPNMGMACFNPTDSFATEVALNKPSITYDLSGIKQSKDVTVIEKEKEESPDIVEEVHREEAVPKPIEIITIEEGEEKTKRSRAPSFEDYIETNAIIYRSHYNKDVAVALTEEEWEGQKYLDVKIQVPTKFVYSSHSEIRIKLDNLPLITKEVNQEYFKSLGYQVEGGFQSGRLKSQLIKENIDIAVWSFSNVEEEEDDEEEPEKRGTFSGFSIRVRDQSTLTPELEEEFKKVLEAYGFNPDVLSQAEITPRTIQDVDLEPAIDIDLDTFDWGQALRTELEWLQNNKVISGLTDDDLNEIEKVADKGTAGWNSKIRYFKGEWVQGITEEMSEETGMYMVKSFGGCGGFPIDLLPEEVPSGVEATDEEIAWIRDQIERWKENPEMKIGGTSIDCSARKTVTLWVYERTPVNQQLHREMIGGWEIIVAESPKPPLMDTIGRIAGFIAVAAVIAFILILIYKKFQEGYRECYKEK